MTELSDALKVNEAAMGNDRMEYQSMLKNSFDGMLERLSAFFEEKVFFKFKHAIFLVYNGFV